jgi:hypothetical protein
MANSRRLYLIEYLRDTILARIDEDNGYNLTLAKRVRGLRRVREWPDSDFPAIFIGGQDESSDNLTNVDFQAQLELRLFCVVKNSSGVDGAMRDLDLLIEDVRKAIGSENTSGAGNLFQNQKCDAIQIKRIETDDGDDEAFAVARIDLMIQYTNEETTP